MDVLELSNYFLLCLSIQYLPNYIELYLQFALLPQGQVEAKDRVTNMVNKMDELGFGNCTNEAECEASCPKGISISNIARMNREYTVGSITGK